MTLFTAMRWVIAAVGLALPLGIGSCAAFLTPSLVQAQVSLNLRDADLRNFVEIVSEATGRSFVLDPSIRGTVTVLAPAEMTPAELYEVFLSVLELNRLTVIEGNGVDRIVQMSNARELASGPAAVNSIDGAYESRVIQVRHISAQEVLEVVRPLLPPEAVLTPVPGTSILILSDRGQNFRRIEALIKRLDQPRDAPIQMIRLRNANASDVAQVIESMGIIPQGAALTVDRRSNALILSGPEALREKVRILASRLDTQQNNVSSHAIALNYADASTMADVVLRAITTEGDPNAAPIRIIPEPQTNSLLISAPQDRISDIVEMVQYLDRRPRQVLVEAVIFEMSVDGFADLSVQFAAILNNALVGGAQFSLQGRPSLTNLISSVASGNSADPGSGGVLGLNERRGDNGVVGLITAIASTNSTRLLSTPSIMTLNNQEAEIIVAQNVPFVTGSFTETDGASPDNPFQTIERQDVGLTLNVTPQINADRTVKMEIEQEVSNLTNAQSSAGGEITAKRSLKTTVLVNDGNVILLGGLLENGSGSVSQKVPGLSKLPLVGGLFRGKNTSKNQRVLLVLLRPQVVNTQAEARKLTQEITREAKLASKAIQPLDRGQYPRTPDGSLPFDGADLNQPFDAGFVDDLAQRRNYPPLPSRLKFDKY